MNSVFEYRYIIYSYFVDKIKNEIYYITLDNSKSTKVKSKFVLLNENFSLVKNFSNPYRIQF